jgi:CubicO group peptidase (beta-lactamase class C family)
MRCLLAPALLLVAACAAKRVRGPEDVPSFLAGLPLESTPGTRGSYSNTGFELAGIAGPC